MVTWYICGTYNCLLEQMYGFKMLDGFISIIFNTGYILSHYRGWIHPGESLVKIWSINSLSLKIVWIVYLNNNFTWLSTSREKYRIIDSPQWVFDFHPDEFWYYPYDITQSFVCSGVSSGSQQSVVTFPQ